MILRQRITGVMCVALLAVAGASLAVSVEKPCPTELSRIPWTGQPSSGGPKVVYGEDDRIDVYQETDTQRRAWAASTCALVDPGQMLDNGDGTYSLATYEYYVSGYPPCAGEPFAGQPTAAFCTGFVVGPDLIATAGHCAELETVENTVFIFGFEMQDAETPLLTFTSDQIYSGMELVARQYDDLADYSIVRVDRPITAPGAKILPARRSGDVPLGTPIGVIGHPAGLPTKLAFGEATVVMDNSEPGYFIANLDTFGGNSGSPVFDPATGLVEGILVYGETDYVLDGDCFRSNQLANEQGAEGVTKSTVFADYLPGGTGQILLDKPRYRCADTLQVSVSDAHLHDAGQVMVRLITDTGDNENLALPELSVGGFFALTLEVSTAAPLPGNGALEVTEGEAIIAIYEDADDGWGEAASFTASASVDCHPPVIRNVAVGQIGGHNAYVTFQTSEPALGVVRAGQACGEYQVTAQGELTATHRILVSGLTPESTTFFSVEAVDRAGNSTADDNQGACYSFSTISQADYFTEFLDGDAPSADVVNKTITFVPDESISMYHACVTDANEYPTNPACGRRLFIPDDDFVRIAVREDKTVSLYGVEYKEFYVGTNGYITFGGGDSSHQPSLENHFAMPRVSGYFGALSPGLLHPVSLKQLTDRVAITYDNVPDYWGDRHSFQIELFFDGVIRITWLKLSYPYGVTGLSAGAGVPFDFQTSDFSAYPACTDDIDEAPKPCLGCQGGAVPASGGLIPDFLVLLGAGACCYWGCTRNRKEPGHP